MQLTYVEFELLRTLASNPAASAAGSCSRPWGDSAYREPRTIDVHVRHLREKLEQDASDPEFILTVPRGYRFRDTWMRLRTVGLKLSLALIAP